MLMLYSQDIRKHEMLPLTDLTCTFMIENNMCLYKLLECCHKKLPVYWTMCLLCIWLFSLPLFLNNEEFTIHYF